MPSLLIELEYHLRSARVRWVLWGGLLLGALVVAGWGVRQLQASAEGLAVVRGQSEDYARAEAEARQALSAYTLPPQRPQDFTAHLPVSPPMADVMQNLHRACAQAGVVLAGVQATHRPASAQQLARIELTVLLRGPYSGARAALDTVLERHSALTLQRLRMRRTTSPTDLETSATLSLWGRPALAGEAS